MKLALGLIKNDVRLLRCIATGEIASIDEWCEALSKLKGKPVRTIRSVVNSAVLRGIKAYGLYLEEVR
jgi:hypothetical protein